MTRNVVLSKIRTCVIGDTLLERECRFVLGKREQKITTSVLGGDLANAVSFKLPRERLTKVTHRRRANLIAVAEVAGILAMIYSYTVMRYILRKTETRES